MITSTARFRDLDISFRTDSVTGDLLVVEDENAVKQSIKTLVLANQFDYWFDSNLGGNVRSLLFELATPLTRNLIRQNVIDVVKSREPRAILLDVYVQQTEIASASAFQIRIVFKTKNSPTPIKFDLILQRVR